jgi:hypothetical protein
MLVKVYGNDLEAEKRYSPAICTGCKKQVQSGDPDPKSYQHVLRRAAESHDADVHAAVHPPDKCLLKKD